MMTYDQAKLFECTRTGIGASFGEIKRLTGWKTNRAAQALKECVEAGYVGHHVVNGAMYFAHTETGEKAYETWSNIPF